MSPAKAKGPRCPVCGKAADKNHHPFCSRRCQDVDLGRWLKGVYVVPGPDLDESEGLPPVSPDPSP